jgi:glycosyltransferase involved in cell wall biosynthesis
MRTSAVDSAAQVNLPDRRLKVAVLNRIFSSTGGGAERYSIALVEQLAAKYEIHVFAQEINHAWPGVSYHLISGWFKKPRWLNQLWYAYASWRATGQGFDIVHSHENVWNGQVQTIHVKTVKRSVLAGRVGWRRALRWLKIVLSPRLISYLALERTRMSPRPGTAIVAVSQNLQEEVLAQYPQAKPHIHIITPGVGLPQQTLTQAQARTALGVPTEGRYVLFVANDYARKGLSTLLEALRDMDGVHLLVVGHPGQIERYQTVAGGLGLQGRVHFLGSLQEMDAAYFAADVLAHPTLQDSFAMVVLEAMAHGLPVVVSSGAYCGIASSLTHDANALILNYPEDALALRQALVRVLNDSALANTLRQMGETFANQHSWQHTAQAYARLYEELSKPVKPPV